MAEWEDIPGDDGWEDVATPAPVRSARKKGPEDPLQKLQTRESVLEYLHDKYGDPGTKTTRKIGGARKPVISYDEKELTKRYYKDELGVTPGGEYERILEAGSNNPFVHLGKYISDLKDGFKQLTSGMNEEEAKDFIQRQQEYGVGDHSTLSQVGAVGLGILPSIATSPIAGTAAASQLARVPGMGGLGRYGGTLANHLAMQRIRDAAVTRGAIGGAVEGTLMPVDPRDSAGDQISSRVQHAALGAGFGAGATGALNFAGNALRSGQTNVERWARSHQLPHRLEITPDKLTGDRQLEAFMNTNRTYGSAAGRTSAVADRIQEMDKASQQSFIANLDALEKRSTGTGDKIRIGEYGDEILETYFKRYNQSKDKVSQRYNNLPDRKHITTNVGEFRDWRDELIGKLHDQGYIRDINSPGPLGRVLKTLENRLGERTKKGLKRQRRSPVSVRDLHTFQKELNRETSKAFEVDQYKHLRPAMMTIKNELDDYITNRAVYNYTDKASGARRKGTAADIPDLMELKNAQNFAASHYRKYTGDEIMDDFLKYADTPRYKWGETVTPGTDLVERLFQSSGGRMDSDVAPRANAIQKIRQAIGGQKIKGNDMDNALRKEAFAAFRQGVEEGDVNTFATNAEAHLRTGQYSDIYDPNGPVALFNDRDFAALNQLADGWRLQHTPLKSKEAEMLSRRTLPLPNGVLAKRLQRALTNDVTGPDSTLGAIKESLPIIGPVSQAHSRRAAANRLQEGVPGNFGVVQTPHQAFPIFEAGQRDIPLESELDNDTYKRLLRAAQRMMGNE